MKYLRTFLDNYKFDDVKYDVDGVLCQLKDIGVDYTVSNYMELIIIRIVINKEDINIDFDEIISQLDELMSVKGYKSRLIHKDDNYTKYYLPNTSKYSLEYFIGRVVKEEVLKHLNGIYSRVRD